jgi:putative membrane protein
MLVKTTAHETFWTLIRYLKVEALFSLVYASMIYYLYDHKNLEFLASFSFIPISFFGAILSVFLAFRNNNAYGRWWEARQLWGDLVNASRMIGLQTMTLIASKDPNYPSEREEEQIRTLRSEVIYRHVAYINLLRMQLRGDIHLDQVQHYLGESDRQRMTQSINPATQLLLSQGEKLKEAANEGLLSDYQLISMMDTLARFYNIQGSCERIKNTPFPREYDGFIRYLLGILLSIIPIYFLGIFSDDLSKVLIIPITIVVALVLGFANKAGEIMEDPFENRLHDIPMTDICNTIERDMLQQLHTTSPIPEKIRTQENIVW